MLTNEQRILKCRGMPALAIEARCRAPRKTRP